MAERDLWAQVARRAWERAEEMAGELAAGTRERARPCVACCRTLADLEREFGALHERVLVFAQHLGQCASYVVQGVRYWHTYCAVCLPIEQSKWRGAAAQRAREAQRPEIAMPRRGRVGPSAPVSPFRRPAQDRP